MKTLALFVIAASLFIIWRVLVDSLDEATMGVYYD